MSIQCLKTIIGEDLIGDVHTTMSGDVVINNPFMVLINGNGQGGFTISLFPYLTFAKKREFTFGAEQTMFQYEPNDDLRNEYTRITSGLVVTSQMPDTAKSDLRIIQ